MWSETTYGECYCSGVVREECIEVTECCNVDLHGISGGWCNDEFDCIVEEEIAVVDSNGGERSGGGEAVFDIVALKGCV